MIHFLKRKLVCGYFILKEFSWWLADFFVNVLLQSKQKPKIPIPPERSMTQGARADSDWSAEIPEKQVTPYCQLPRRESGAFLTK